MNNKFSLLHVLSIIVILILTNCSSEPNLNSEPTNEDELPQEKLQQKSKKRIIFFGNSLTAGYGLEKEQAYPNLIQKKLDALKYDFEVVNAGVSGATTSNGVSSIDWYLKEGVDLFLLELGANDGLRGINTELTERNLRAIIERVREVNKDVTIILAGMKVPPSMGQDYGEKFEEIFPKVADQMDVHLIPFFLEGVAGNPELNQADGIHPTAQGAQIVAETVWNAIKPLLDN